MYCHKCGCENPDDARFCTQCGEILDVYPDTEAEGCGGSSFDIAGEQVQQQVQQKEAQNDTSVSHDVQEESAVIAPKNKKINPLVFIIPAALLMVVMAIIVLPIVYRFASRYLPLPALFDKKTVVTEEIEDVSAGLTDIAANYTSAASTTASEKEDATESTKETATTDYAQTQGENTENNAFSANREYPQQAVEDWSYVMPDSSTRYLDRAELEGLSKYDLRIARNEIYARHGRKFSDPALSSYFSSKAWYTPSIDADKFNEDVLNKIEKANLELIKSVESSDTARTEQKVYDKAGLFTESERLQIERYLADMTSRMGMDFIVLTTANKEGKSQAAYADDFYDYNGCGIGGNRSGLLFMIDMENRSCYISTSGDMIDYLNDARLAQILQYDDELWKRLNAGKYAYAVTRVAEEVESYYSLGLES